MDLLFALIIGAAILILGNIAILFFEEFFRRKAGNTFKSAAEILLTIVAVAISLYYLLPSIV